MDILQTSANAIDRADFTHCTCEHVCSINREYQRDKDCSVRGLHVTD